MAFKLLPEKMGKYDKRVSPFSAVCTDVRLEEAWGNDVKLVFEFGENEPILPVNLKVNNWIDDGEGGRTPKQGSNAHKLLMSLQKLGIDFDLDIATFEFSTSPSLLGKLCSFACKTSSFVNDAGNSCTNYIWTLAKVEDPNAPSKVKETPRVSVPVDMGEVRKNWLRIIDSIEGNDPFGFPKIVMARGKFLQGKTFSDEESQYYKDKDQVKAQIAALVEEGYLTMNIHEYTKVPEMIEAGLV